MGQRVVIGCVGTGSSLILSGLLGITLLPYSRFRRESPRESVD